MVSQICKYDGARERRFLKRAAARLSRRLGRQFLEDAPRRVTKGWWT